MGYWKFIALGIISNLELSINHVLESLLVMRLEPAIGTIPLCGFPPLLLKQFKISEPRECTDCTNTAYLS